MICETKTHDNELKRTIIKYIKCIHDNTTPTRKLTNEKPVFICHHQHPASYFMSHQQQRRPSATGLLCELTKLRAQQKYLEAGAGDESARHLPADVVLQRSQLATVFQQTRCTAQADIADCRRQLGEFQRLGAAGRDRLDMRSIRDEVLRLDTLIRALRVASDVRPLRAEYERLRRRDGRTEAAADGHGDDDVDDDDGTGALLNEALLLNEMPPKPWPSAACGRKRTAALTACGRQRREASDRAEQASASRDVRRFLDLLATHGGHTGGWTEPEHQQFVRAKCKYDGSAARMAEAIWSYPGFGRDGGGFFFINCDLFEFYNVCVSPPETAKTEEDIANHDKWFERYCEAKKRYKEAIADWKKNLK